MQIRLYVDEDAMARALVQGLRARGIDVLTVLEAGMSEQDDRAQLEYATAQGRVLYTFNVGHFWQLHSEYLAQGRSHAGMILVYRQRYSYWRTDTATVESTGNQVCRRDEKQCPLSITYPAFRAHHTN